MKQHQLNHGIIILLEFYPSWLALSRERRKELAGDLYRIIEKYSEHVKVHFLLDRLLMKRRPHFHIANNVFFICLPRLFVKVIERRHIVQ